MSRTLSPRRPLGGKLPGAGHGASARVFRPAALAAALLLAGTGLPALAQGPPARPLPEKHHMNKQAVVLPIRLEPRLRGSLREVQLYVKDHPARPWVFRDKALPTQGEFLFRAPRDGEYWFAVVTVDAAGRLSPDNLTSEPPQLVVVIDTERPQAELRCLPPSAEGICVQCVAKDAGPEPVRVRVEYQTGDKQWRAASLVPGSTDTYCIPGQALLTGMVRVEAADRAGNTFTKETHLSSCPGVNAAVLAALQGVSPRQMEGPVLPPPPPGNVHTVSHQEPQAAPGQKPPRPFPPEPQRVQKAPTPNSMPPVPVGAVVTPNEGGPQGNPHVAQAGAQKPIPTGSRQIVNNRKVVLDYRIDQMGPSGVGRVEIYMTRDRGQSWLKYGEDADRASPAEVELPGEGVYGVSLVVSNGRGFGATPPAPGDQADWWIEVDLTKPAAELLAVQPSPEQEPGVMVISWNARDKNLGQDPIDLHYASNKEGPWVPIARGLKNEGAYRWTIPQEVGSQAYVRVTVSDLARNVSIAETQRAVPMDDLSRPRIRVVNVTTPAAGAAAPAPLPVPEDEPGRSRE